MNRHETKESIDAVFEALPKFAMEKMVREACMRALHEVDRKVADLVREEVVRRIKARAEELLKSTYLDRVEAAANDAVKKALAGLPLR